MKAKMKQFTEGDDALLKEGMLVMFPRPARGDSIKREYLWKKGHPPVRPDLLPETIEKSPLVTQFAFLGEKEVLTREEYIAKLLKEGFQYRHWANVEPVNEPRMEYGTIKKFGKNRVKIELVNGHIECVKPHLVLPAPQGVGYVDAEVPEEEEPGFKEGDDVLWMTGKGTDLQGVIRFVIPAGKQPDLHLQEAYGVVVQEKFSVQFIGINARTKDSYMVEVPGRGKPKLYWPLPEKLVRVSE